MQHVVDYLRTSVIGLGGFGGGLGLFFVAFCGSSFLSLPEVNDLLIVYFCIRFKDQTFYYATMAVLGSATGCTVLYWLGRSKGHRFLGESYSKSRLSSAMKFFQRYGMLALIGPALLPPPFPFNNFLF